MDGFNKNIVILIEGLFYTTICICIMDFYKYILFDFEHCMFYILCIINAISALFYMEYLNNNAVIKFYILLKKTSIVVLLFSLFYYYIVTDFNSSIDLVKLLVILYELKQAFGNMYIVRNFA